MQQQADASVRKRLRGLCKHVQEWVEVEEKPKKKKKKKKKKTKTESAPTEGGEGGTGAGADDGSVSQPVAA